jgi:hypothetical protein
MKRHNSLWAYLTLLLCVTTTAFAQSKAPEVNPGDTLFYTDFRLKPTGTTFPSGDLYTASTSNANKEAVYGGMTFGAGPNGQRINFNNSMACYPYGNASTTYVSETANDDGATTGSIQFIKAGTSGGGGYLILPKVKGPCNITLWSCDGSGYQQSYNVYFKENAVGSYVSQATTTVVAGKKIKKNVYSYTGTDSVQVKFTCNSAASATNTALYMFNVLVQAAGAPTTPALSLLTGATTQTVYQTQTIKSIVYQYGGTATATSIAWTGTASSVTAPDGVTVSTNATAKTVTISGALNTLGTYGYSITATDGTNTTAALTGTLNTKTTSKYKTAYITTVANGVPSNSNDLNFTNALSTGFDLNYISSTDTGVDFSVYDILILSAIPSSGDAGLAELKTKCLSKPFVNMKTFQMQASRWNWMVPANTTTTTVVIPDAQKTHPIFTGITFSGAGNNEISLSTGSTVNAAVDVTSWVGNTPADPTVLATVSGGTGLGSYFEIPVGTSLGGSDATTAKHIILGLSESSWGTLTPNAVQLAVNAAQYVVAKITTKVDNQNDKNPVYYSNNTIYNPNQQSIAIFSTAGIKIKASKEKTIDTQLLPKGIYMVQTAGMKVLKFIK